jgi:hypothetical protein
MTNVELTIERFRRCSCTTAKSLMRTILAEVIIARKPADNLQIDDPRTSLRVESTEGQSQLVHGSPSSMFRRRDYPRVQ